MEALKALTQTVLTKPACSRFKFEIVDLTHIQVRLIQLIRIEELRVARSH